MINELVPLKQIREEIPLITSWLLQVSPSSRTYYKRVILELFSFYPNLGIRDLRITHLSLYIKTMNKSDSTKNTHLFVVKSLFSFCSKSGILSMNPAVLIKPSKVPSRLHSKILTPEEVNRMALFAGNERNKVIVKILYYLAPRNDEIRNVKKSSFYKSGEDLFMMVEGKGRKVRTVKVSPKISKMVWAYISGFSDNEYIFTTPRSQSLPMAGSQLWRIVRSAAKRSGITKAVSPHWYRHTSATHSIENGAPIHVVKESLGHESIETTAKYLDTRPQKSVGDFL